VQVQGVVKLFDGNREIAKGEAAERVSKTKNEARVRRRKRGGDEKKKNLVYWGEGRESNVLNKI